MNLDGYQPLKKIIDLLAGDSRAADAFGMWGSFSRLMAVNLSRLTQKTILYICPHAEYADKAADDVSTFGAQQVETFRAWEGNLEFADAADETLNERYRLALKLFSSDANTNKPLIICTCVQALCQPIPHLKALQQNCLHFETNSNCHHDKITEWLIDNGFEQVEQIDLPGQFAKRGGIIDIYASVSKSLYPDGNSEQGSFPFRLEFFGDAVESIRKINLDTQRSHDALKSLDIFTTKFSASKDERNNFLNILTDDTIVILEEPAEIQEVAGIFKDRCDPQIPLYSWQQLHDILNKFCRLNMYRFTQGNESGFINLNIKSVQQYQHKENNLLAGGKSALDELVLEAEKGKKVYLYCEASAEIKRVTEIICQSRLAIPENLILITGFVHQGFCIDSLDTIIISHHELFGQFALKRMPRQIRAGMPIDTLSDLQYGDYVVHLNYGIGKFRGISTLKENQSSGEFLTIEFADKVKVHVAATNINLVQKYIGTSPKRPQLSKIGTKKWQNQKEKAFQSVQELAKELLEIQAKRQSLGGFQYAKDSNWQLEFEESFPYQETPDQTTGIEQIKSDMERPVAMDRLLCGDVGFGKTELAMRAAFKAVENGKQVAILVPTTVLSVQHGRTFSERFADFPVTVEVLNRFKTSKNAQNVILKTIEGSVDILIGTHRLLSKDVQFKNLGLLVIDEEQRFGVEHKEKLKSLRTDIDILTMTATPIPRTLHMSLLGLRDISSLGTPPLDRRSIVTSIVRYNNDLIRKAILHELNRQGQIFFLHNRVKSIEKKTSDLRKLIPEARFAIAHGQMSKRELEKAMVDFVLGKIDCLVCTTIVESGLDIPNANTIFIDNADQFGLAELHQLRGRVGRYKHRAYAYLLLPQSRPVSSLAAKRIKAIEEYSHLGAGFKIALRDLEIRGAGNILGPEQSGHIQAVGYQMYCDLLAAAVRRLKNFPDEILSDTFINLGFAAVIPKSYIPSDRHRMEVYRKIAVAKSIEDIHHIADELSDVFGPISQDIQMLLDLSELKIKASKFDIKSITILGNNLVFTFVNDPGKKLHSMFAKTKGIVSLPEPRTVYLHLEPAYFEPKTLITILRKILSAKI